MNVLVTGFERFGKHEVNPSQVIAEELDGVVLPVPYARAAGELQHALDERDPEIVIAFGLADDRDAVTPERFAHNLDESDTTDNDAAAGSWAEIDAAGPLAYRSTLPVDEIVAALRARELPAAVSRDAGGYLSAPMSSLMSTATRRRRSAGDDGTRDFASEAPTVLAEELREIVGDEALEAAEEQTHHHGGAWTARVDRRTLAREGDEIELAVSTGRLHFFDLETGSGIYGDEARNSSAANRSAVGTVADQK